MAGLADRSHSIAYNNLKGGEPLMWASLKLYFAERLADLTAGESGQALVEYALILALVSVVAVAILTTLGVNVVADLTNAANAL